jgi:hypothetical protein
MPHFNLHQHEQAMRKSLADDAELDPARVADGLSANFIAAHHRFDELRIQFMLETMRGINDGLGRDEMLAASARALGMLAGSLTLSAVGQRERNLVNGCFTTALSETLVGPVDPNQRVTETVMKSEEGGHA